MTLPAVPPPREDDWTGYIWVVVFIVFPLLARFFKWLSQRFGSGASGRAESEAGKGLSQTREEQRRVESEGEELWRRLARGEVGETAPPVPAPVEPTSLSLEREEEPEALSVLGEVRDSAEPSDASEVSLEREEEPAPLAAMAEPVALAPVQFEDTPEAAQRIRFQLGRGDLRRGILLSEILGPPVSERPLRA